MDRLTRIPFQRRTDDSLENYKVKNDNRNYETSLQNCINKLGKLEDLEEQIGCPLEVMFKALEEGIIINEEGYVNSAYDNKEFNEKEDSYYGCLTLYKAEDDYYFEDTSSPYGDPECGSIGCWVKLSDYQKTWWLKGEQR